MPTKPSPSVLEMIFEWSLSRPLWQRDALRRIVARGRLTDEDIAELVLLCKKENGSADVTLVAQPLTESDLPANPGAEQSVALTSVSDVTSVNQLAASQTLPFDPQGITIIYGDNGAGKSGYARVLKKACRARYPGTIMPDAFDATAARTATANIAYAEAGKTRPPVAWRDDGKPHPVLSAVSVFDRECGAVHIRDKNEVAFRPFGLDIPDELADACQRVKAALSAEQLQLERSRDPAFVTPTWRVDTRPGAILSKLRASTKIDTLEALSTVPAEAKVRHAQLSEDLAKDPLKASAEQVLYANQLQQLAMSLRQVATNVGDAPLQSLKALALDAFSKRAAAKLAAERAFDNSMLPGVGGQVWRAMWNAARHYAEHVAYPGSTFPPSEAPTVCVFCHQPLSPEARARLGDFHRFVEADTERQADEAEKTFAASKTVFDKQRIYAVPHGAIRRKIAISNPGLGRQVLRFLASARRRRRLCEKALASAIDMVLPALEDDPTNSVLELEAAARRYADELRQAADIEGRKSLERERDEIGDCLALRLLLPKVKSEIERLKSLALVGTCLGDTATNVITRLGNDIADEIVTPRMRDQFQHEIVRLAAHRVRVEIVRAGGRYGSPYYQVRLFANPHASVPNVLSEGEQTCVALAAFLTELATAAHRSALVFDDPVSSLDHRWRQQVAQRLVEEADNRQIIVFTHDLVFLNDLKDAADQRGKAVNLVTLSRTPAGAGTVTLGLPWMAASIQDRVDQMEKQVRAAKVLHNNQDEDGYRNSVYRIYNNLRATWERAIEDVAFGGVISRHRDYVNTRYLRRATVLTEADCDAFEAAYKKCCDQTDAHDPSRGRNAAPPSTEDVMNDVQGVLTWVTSLRGRQP